MSNQPMRWPADFPGKHDRYQTDNKPQVRISTQLHLRQLTFILR